MITQCPSCSTVFRIDDGQLQSAGGRVRCGLCSERFDARERLAERLPSEEARPAPARPARPRRRSALRVQVESVLGLDGESPPRRLGPRIGYGLGALVLVLALAVQYLHFEAASLAADPAWRGTVASVCAVTGCRLPPRRAPQAVTVVDRQVRAHPRVEDALLVEATLVNQAGFPQPYPQLQLTLSALNGQVTGHHWFAPRTYLADPSLDPAGLMPPDEPVSVRLAVRDPGRSESFAFDFR